MRTFSYYDLSCARDILAAKVYDHKLAASEHWMPWAKQVKNMFDIFYGVVGHLKKIGYCHRDAIARAWWLVKNSGKNSYAGILKYLYKRESARTFAPESMFYAREKRIYDPITGQCITQSYIRKGRSKSGKHELRMRRARTVDNMQSIIGYKTV